LTKEQYVGRFKSALDDLTYSQKEIDNQPKFIDGVYPRVQSGAVHDFCLTDYQKLRKEQETICRRAKSDFAVTEPMPSVESLVELILKARSLSDKLDQQQRAILHRLSK
jgi:hypothetical protein